MASNWPIDADFVRGAIEYAAGEGDNDELTLYAETVCERIDKKTGRNVDPTRHEVSGKVPSAFLLAAKKTVRLWWYQDNHGPRARPNTEPTDPAEGMGGVDLPRVAAGLLADYPPRPGFGS